MDVHAPVALTLHDLLNHTLIVEFTFPGKESKGIHKARITVAVLSKPTLPSGVVDNQVKEGRHHDVQGELGLCLCSPICPFG